MSNNSIDVVVGDTKTEITFTLSDSSGVVNLTGLTINFYIRKQGASTNSNATTLCTIVDASLGIFKYTFLANDLPTVGYYLGQLQITFAGPRIHKVPRFLKINAVESYV